MTTDGDSTQTPESFEFKAEIQELLNILVHSLYTEREIFVRELISNASDALHRIQFEMLTNRDVLDPDASLAIRVEVDREARMITISDTGVGMTRDEIVEDLGTIAHSGAAAFLRELEEERRPGVEMIGQFGVGFYSVFMAAERVRVVSRSHQLDAEPVAWVSDGGNRYQLSSADKAERGTRIEVWLKEDAAEFTDPWRLKQIIRKHSDFVVFPIYVGDEKEPANRGKPLWRQPPREVADGEYGEFYKQFFLATGEPLLTSHLVSDAPVDLRSILYVPARREGGLLAPRTDYGLKLYIHNVLIQEANKDLLPPHWRFVEGVVESADLPLNISRETVQSSPVARQIRRALVRKLTRELETLAQETPDRYLTFWHEFGPFVKEGVATDPKAKEDLLPLLRFHSNRSDGGLTSLAEYESRMGEEQPAIYYVLGDDLRSVARSPHLDYFNAHDLEVLYLVDPVDSFVMVAVQEFDGKPFRNVDDAGLHLPGGEEAEAEEVAAVAEAEFNRLVGRFVKVLGDRVVEVRESNVLTGSPCRLVSPEGTPMREMSRLYKMLDQEYEIPKRILEINRGHPIITNLAHLVTQTPEAEVVDPAIEQLFENQLLMEGLHPNPADMLPRIQQLVELATLQQPRDDGGGRGGVTPSLRQESESA